MANHIRAPQRVMRPGTFLSRRFTAKMAASSRPAVRTKLHEVLQQARQVFADPQGHPSMQSEDVAQLSTVLGEVPLKDLGMQAPEAHSEPGDATGFWRRRKAQRRSMTSQNVYEDEQLSIAIFSLPAGSKLPLHDHEQMVVLSRVLYGQLAIRSFDWLAHGQRNGWARPVRDCVLTPADPAAVLFPRAGGNLHEFTAVSDCAVLDVLSPPYAAHEGRDCRYYEEREQDASGNVWLQALAQEPAFDMFNAPYQGVRLH